MSSATLRLVLVVSCCHALVHVFEQSLPSVEFMIGQEFGVGREVTGGLGTAWRVPFGGAAFLAGWLADRWGARRLIVIYLFGCAAMAAATCFVRTLPLMFGVMFTMGLFASIYHPAGLAMISHETEPENRGRALGLHGILGSMGIAGAPLLAAVFFAIAGAYWRNYYLFLAVLGLAAAAAARMQLPDRRYGHEGPRASDLAQENTGRWIAFFILVAVGTMFGFIYAAFTHFLPRYLDTAGVFTSALSPDSQRTLLSGGVLMWGALGQWIAGRLASRRALHQLFVLILLGNAPCLLWMALAQGQARVWATALTSILHFMHQPVYNSLVALYVPRQCRSAGYGFSNMMCFGLGALGPLYAGATGSDLICYASLAVLALLSAVMAGVLWRMDSNPTAGESGAAH